MSGAKNSIISLIYFLIALADAAMELNFENITPDLKCAEYLRANAIGQAHKFLPSTAQRDATATLPTIYLIGDSTMRNKKVWSTILGQQDRVSYLCTSDMNTTEWNSLIDTEGRSFHATANSNCLLDSDNSHSLQWAEVILWNQGEHDMHLLPAREPAGTEISDLFTYETMLRHMAKKLQHLAERRQGRSHSLRLFYKLTNTVCEESYEGNYKTVSDAWMYSPEYTMRPEYEMQMTRVGSSYINYVEKKVMREMNITVLNTFTADACDCTKKSDGRHYFPIVPGFWQQFLNEIGAYAAAGATVETSDEVPQQQQQEQQQLRREVVGRYSAGPNDAFVAAVTAAVVAAVIAATKVVAHFATASGAT